MPFSSIVISEVAHTVTSRIWFCETAGPMTEYIVLSDSLQTPVVTASVEDRQA